MSPWRALLYASWRAFLHAIRRTPPARKIWVGPKSGVQKCTPDGVQKCTPCRESLFGVHFCMRAGVHFCTPVFWTCWNFWRAFLHASPRLACRSARQRQHNGSGPEGCLACISARQRLVRGWRGAGVKSDG